MMTIGTQIFNAIFMTGAGWLFIAMALIFLAIQFQWGNIELKKARFLVQGTVAVIAIIGLWNTGIIDIATGGQLFAVAPVVAPAQPTVQDTETPLTGDTTPQVGVCTEGCARQTDGTNTLKTVIRNAENASLAYLSASITAESNGVTHDTGTSTGGTSLSYADLNVPPCQVGTIYVLATTGVGIASADVPFSSCKMTSEYEILSSNQDVISILGRSNALQSASDGDATGGVALASGQKMSGASTTDGNAYYYNTTFSSGTTLNHYIDLSVNGTSSVFGKYKATDGIMISFDSVDASKFSNNALSLSGVDGFTITKVSCPSTISANRDAEACWSLRTLQSSDGDVRLKGSLQADLGDPASDGSDNPKICVDDKVYFRDKDGDIKYDFFDSSGTNQGVAGVCLTYYTER